MQKAPSNKPRDEIDRLARQRIKENGGPELARVWFKFTCAACGSREHVPIPNTLPEEGLCSVCGQRSIILGAGFALETRRDRSVDWDDPQARKLVVRKPYASDRGDA